MSQQESQSRLILDDPAGSRVRVSEKSLNELIVSQGTGDGEQHPSPSQDAPTNNESVLVIDEPGGTRIRVRLPKL